jgi:hypothetical protein
MLWHGGTPLAYTVMCILFLGALISTICVRTNQKLQSKVREPIFQSLQTGIKFMIQHRIMLGAFYFGFVRYFAAVRAVALLPLFAEMLKVGELGLRYLTRCHLQRCGHHVARSYFLTFF